MSALDDAAASMLKPERDGYGRPLLLNLEGERVPYTRASTMAGYISDYSGLEVWKKRLLALGLARRPDLQALLTALPPIVSDVAGGSPTAAEKRQDLQTKREVDAIIERALEEAHQHAKADWGTAVHGYVEHGLTPVDRMVGDVDAVRTMLNRIGGSVDSEVFVVNDRLMAAGSYDHQILNVNNRGETTGHILDIKTGTLHFDAHALQLHIYASATVYDVDTDERGEDLTETVDQEVGYVLHAPAGQGWAELYEVDLQAGARAANAAAWVRGYRSGIKNLSRKIDSTR